VSADPRRLALREVSANGTPGRELDFPARLVVLGGYSARTAEERQRHVAELRTIGIEPPERVPAFWAVGTGLLTTGRRIEVQGGRTSGEIEYALLFTGGRVLVAAASDQTDREFEVHSIPRAKQLCAKVLSRDVVPLDELRPRWDELVLSSEVRRPTGDWSAYQRSPLAAMLPPDELVAACFGGGAVPDGTVLLSGTVPLLDGITRYLPEFRGALRVPGSPVALSLEYQVHVLPERFERLGVDASGP
jgi:hypothetical protein